MKNYCFFYIFIVIIIVFACAPPDAPSPGPSSLPDPPSAAAVRFTGSSLFVSWDGVPEADSYKIYREVNYGQFLLLTDYQITETSFDDTNFNVETTYRYAVASVNENGASRKSEPSDSISISADSVIVHNPDASVYEFDNKIKVSWDVFPNADSYNVYRSLDKNFSSPVLCGNSIVNYFEDTLVEGETPCFYSVLWVKNDTEYGQAAEPVFGIFGDVIDVYEQNDDYTDVKDQAESTIFDIETPPLLFNYPDGNGDFVRDIDWYKYAGNSNSVMVTISFPFDTDYLANEVTFQFFYNESYVGTEHYIVNPTSDNTFMFDGFSGESNPEELYFVIKSRAAFVRRSKYTMRYGI